MLIKRSRTPRRLVRSTLTVAALVAVAAIPWSDSNAQSGPAFSIDYHVITSGGTRLRNSCFVLSGTAGETSPGYSSGGVYALLAGFWPAAPVVNQDQLFFDGFEGC
jgi:hypothetical protein